MEYFRGYKSVCFINKMFLTSYSYTILYTIEVFGSKGLLDKLNFQENERK